jgi:hypothetical protein
VESFIQVNIQQNIAWSEEVEKQLNFVNDCNKIDTTITTFQEITSALSIFITT